MARKFKYPTPTYYTTQLKGVSIT